MLTQQLTGFSPIDNVIPAQAGISERCRDVEKAIFWIMET